MGRLSKPFTNWDNLFKFCTIGFFWVSNAGPLLEGKRTFLRLFIYPVYISFISVFLYLLFNFKKNRSYFDKSAYKIFWWLIIICCICVIRGISHLDINSLRSMLFNRAGAAIVWLMPLSMLFALKTEFWFTYIPKIRGAVVFGIFYVFIVMSISISTGIIFKHKMYNSTDFLFLSPFLIVLSRYKEDTINLIIGYIGVAILSAWMFIINERFAIAYAGLMCLFYLLSILMERYRLNLKVNMAFLMLFSCIIFLGIIMNTSFFKAYINRYIYHGEILEDTRGKGSLASAVTKNMTAFEKTFGKGINGLYVWGTRGWPPAPYIRPNVEIGYMQLVLKGGYLMLLLFLCFSLYAIYLGIFRTKNRLTKYLAYIIIARLIIMSTALIPRIGFEYFMFWLVIGGCISPQLRKLSDEQVLDNYKQTKIIIKW